MKRHNNLTTNKMRTHMIDRLLKMCR